MAAGLLDSWERVRGELVRWSWIEGGTSEQKQPRAATANTPQTCEKNDKKGRTIKRANGQTDKRTNGQTTIEAGARSRCAADERLLRSPERHSQQCNSNSSTRSSSSSSSSSCDNTQGIAIAIDRRCSSRRMHDPSVRPFGVFHAVFVLSTLEVVDSRSSSSGSGSRKPIEKSSQEVTAHCVSLYPPASPRLPHAVLLYSSAVSWSCIHPLRFETGVRSRLLPIFGIYHLYTTPFLSCYSLILPATTSPSRA